MANLFAYRATEPSAMKAVIDPIGRLNNNWLLKLAEEHDRVIAAWGNDGCFLGRSKEVVKLLPAMYCLKINRSGEPAHPLYLKADLKPRLMGLNREIE